MTQGDRHLLIENTAALRGLNAKLEEFEKHITERIEKLEKREGEQKGNFKSTLALVLSAGMLAVNVIVNFFKHGGK
ncbi:hypothetical protein FACS189485_14110 [Spirochaetia bacterium]|nr:hypothetical protein FACS189485_14110 [Spirochaetia bacterium]